MTKDQLDKQIAIITQDAKKNYWQRGLSFDEMILVAIQTANQQRDVQAMADHEGLLQCRALLKVRDTDNLYDVIQRLLKQRDEEIMLKGAECACSLTGDPEAMVRNVEEAWKAINECLRLGQQRNDELNALQRQRDDDTARLREALELALHWAEQGKPCPLTPLQNALAARGVQPAAKEREPLLSVVDEATRKAGELCKSVTAQSETCNNSASGVLSTETADTPTAQQESAPAAEQNPKLGMVVLPMPEGLDFRNGGEQCDMLTGPCACGAWHQLEDLPRRIFTQLKAPSPAQEKPVEASAWRMDNPDINTEDWDANGSPIQS